MSPVTVAAVQAAPEFLDRDATIGKVVALAEKAASRGARLVAFPEAFVPGYPDWVWRTRPWDATATVLYARLLEQAVVADSAACDALAKAARRLGIWLSVGATERDQTSSTLYNALLHFAPDGTLACRHRKLMPSGGERLVWGAGDGSGLAAACGMSRSRRHLDPAGHYNRPDIFRLQVNTSPRPAVIESGTIAAISQLNGGSDEHHASDEHARA